MAVGTSSAQLGSITSVASPHDCDPRTGEGLRVGSYICPVPVVLAPMAGITNRAFRRLCRESGAAVYVSEMTTSRALVERNPATLDMVAFDSDENPRSVQIYGVEPVTVAAAVELLVGENRCDHIDLNMGCPVPKVTRKGGGAALPWKHELFRAIVSSAVDTARRESDRRGVAPVPVSVKMRMGIDREHLTYRPAAEAAIDAGVAWVALHARTAEQLYGGQADWSAIADLVQAARGSGVPVLGNGDVWTAADALRMVDETGCAGVVVGRGCLGRPWLFRQLSQAFRGETVDAEPNLPEVMQWMRRHAELLCAVLGADKGCRDFRKHVAWYLKGFAVGSEVRRALAMVSDLQELDTLLARIDPDQTYDGRAATSPRGRTSGARSVALPDGWLSSQDLTDDDRLRLRAAELSVSGG